MPQRHLQSGLFCRLLSLSLHVLPGLRLAPELASLSACGARETFERRTREKRRSKLGVEQGRGFATVFASWLQRKSGERDGPSQGRNAVSVASGRCVCVSICVCLVRWQGTVRER
jgi:hypothetical protein